MGRLPRFFVVNLLRKHSGHNGRIGQFAKLVKFDKYYTIRGKTLAGADRICPHVVLSVGLRLDHGLRPFTALNSWTQLA